MVLLRPFIQPTVGAPQPVVAPQRKRRLRPGEQELLPDPFYEQAVAQARPVTVTFEDRKRYAPPEQQEQGLAQAPLSDMETRPPVPHLSPGERVKSPSMELVQPSSFRQFYERLNTISGIGEEQVGAEQARSRFKQLADLQRIMSQQVPSFQGATLQGGMESLTTKQASKYAKQSAPLHMLGNVRPNARQAAREISGRFGFSNIGGHATSGHIPGSDHYSGRAIDVMGGRSSVVRYAMSNKLRLGVKYIIHNRRYYAPENNWQGTRYTGENPHTGHVHISFY